MKTGLRDHLIAAQAALSVGLESVARDPTGDMPAIDSLEFISELRDLLLALERHLPLRSQE